MSSASAQSLVLNNVLELSVQLQRSIEGAALHTDVRPLRLELSEVSKRAQTIARDKPYDYNRGTFLLAQASNNPEHTEYAINLINLAEVASALRNIDTDLDAFVKHARERNIISIIESRRREAEEDFQAFVRTKLALDWPARKNFLVEQFEKRKLPQESQRTDADQQQSTHDKGANIYWQTSEQYSKGGGFDDITLPQAEDSAWGAKEQTFAQAICSLNEHRQMKQSVAIGSLMSQLTRSLATDIRTHQLADAWQMISFIANEKHVEHGKVPAGRLLQARQYMSEYAATRQSVITNRMVIDGSRRYLEDQFFSLIEREIARNPQQARLGGLPTIESKVKAYVNLRLQKNGNWTVSTLELVNNVPIWAVLFYLMRAGFTSEAAQYSARNEMIFSKIEKNWCSYMNAYASDPSHDLPRALADKLHTEYNQRLKYGTEGTDPYKQALFKIIGRCDLSHKTIPAILPVTEDWLWLQLSLLKETNNPEAKYEQYDLNDLQETLLHYGERHFNPKNNSPLLYFQILLLSGQFERAVHNLASKSWTDAVHFAIVFAYYGLLRVPTQMSRDNVLLHEEDNVAQLQFSALIKTYVLQIRAKNPIAAVEYIALICLNADLPQGGKSHIDSCHDVLRSLILETRDFASLLGDIKSDGSRESGFIEKRLNLLGLQDEQQYLRTITEQAAAVSEQEGRIADAILLYHLSEEYDVVVNLLNNFLGSALLEQYSLEAKSRPALSISHSEDPASLAKNMLALYRNNASILSAISRNNLESCRMLLAIVDSHEQFRGGNHSSCLAIIDQLSLLPTGENLSVGMIKDMAHAFTLLDDSVARNVPGLLLLTVNCLKSKLDMLEQGDFNVQSRKMQAQVIKTKARNLNTFAGLIKYQMSEDLRIAFENVASVIR